MKDNNINNSEKRINNQKESIINWEEELKTRLTKELQKQLNI